ncbi:MAG TPA: DUF979 domain-containing protein [Actinomadura sp.]|nr:DUF979 domain-containing protein [Actinomadura sp.]
MIKSEWFYWLIGLIFLIMAGQMLMDRTNPKRFGSAGFWGLVGAGFIYATWVVRHEAPPEPLGVAVLVMAGLGGFGLTGQGERKTTTPEKRERSALRLGNRLFIPALTIPVVAVVCATALKGLSIGGTPLLEKTSETILGLGFGAITALAVGMIILRERRVVTPLNEGRSLLEAMGSVMVLPQMLATLGTLFAVAGVGKAVRRITENALPSGQIYIAVAVYCIGMAVFTFVMGNAFAAFPVMTAAIGWPVLIQQAGGDPAVVLAVGMLAGFCGTLTTPMAANFNIVPAALLELKDQYGPIKAQVPTAVPLLACNIVIMAIFAF